jgi:peptide/nickel transport system permease protein
MTFFLLRRLLQTPLMLFGVVVFTFFLIHAAPGDPVITLAGEYGNEAYYEQMRAKYGLDRPVIEQFFIYLEHLLRGDLGRSFITGQPVLQTILSRVPTTLLLVVSALTLSSLVGVSFGMISAWRPFTLTETIINLFALLGYALPVFWLAQMLIFFLAAQLGWFPIYGLTNARERYTGMRLVLDIAHHLALPMTALAIQQVALITRLTRSGMREILRQPFILTARAKGVPNGRLVLHHALRNALLPVVTVIGGRVGFLFAGALLTETVFAWPGLGLLLFNATRARDYPMLMGIFLLISFTVIVANLITDLIYLYLDPRISYR